MGRPFLTTGHILIDYKKDELTMRVTDQCVTVSVFHTLKYMDESEECQNIFKVDSLKQEKVLKRCEEVNLVLNWEKCHFMVTKGIVLGHKISHKGIEMDKAKIKVIEKLPPQYLSRALEASLDMLGSIEDSQGLIHDIQGTFIFDKNCHYIFIELKQRIISVPIVVPPD
ncbi:uncharacterized protein LOC120154682 [Hibiscus syriacus]|uniref:uncharacterized protein LOC120154682 n=1 Tax=Hibiscus syriacus TaxID=106335 RepID=UPI0019231256|nr:uncharacterized protein LOC120154682 [Hibiscus syriacus]